MAVAEQEQTEEQNGGSASRTALKAAAAAAATGAATFAVKKALSHGDNDDDSDETDDADEPMSRSKKSKPKSGDSLIANAASSAWDSAQDIVMPIAEDAVAAAGKYLAENAPDVVRERLVPRFIEAFNEAS